MYVIGHDNKLIQSSVCEVYRNLFPDILDN